MKYIAMLIFIFGLLIIQSCNFNHAGTPDVSRKEPQASMMEALEYAISSTPYSALIQYTSDDVSSIPKSYPANELDEEKHIYHARVLETYRGERQTNISFTLICEKGDGLINDEKPVVVTLCIDNEGFFWPGTGSEFPATKEIIKAAQRISQNVKFEKQSFPQCEYSN
ncbi:MAG: hypothetical protein WAU91_11805 [Desulfatitalea sp.]